VHGGAVAVGRHVDDRPAGARGAAEKANAESVSAFLEQMLAYSNPLIKASGKDGGETTLKDVLDEAAVRLDGEEFSGQLEVKADRPSSPPC
jgi:hypothetical protein